MIATMIPCERVVASCGRRKTRRGAVAVEMALTMTLLILPMLLGIWEISCMADANRAMTKERRRPRRAKEQESRGRHDGRCSGTHAQFSATRRQRRGSESEHDEERDDTAPTSERADRRQ